MGVLDLRRRDVMSMLDDWPTIEEQAAAKERGCTCTITIDTGPNPVDDAEQDPYCVVHGDRVIMRATLDKLRSAIVGQVFKNIGGK